MIDSIVIDTETMDVRPSALLLSIGAIAFDVTDLEALRYNISYAVKAEHHSSESYVFYHLLDANSQIMVGRTVSRSTQMWWRGQGDSAKAALDGDKQDLKEVLEALTHWIAQYPDAQIYFRGTDFDGSILESAYRAYDLKCPWKYNGKRDVRTFIDALSGSDKGYIADHEPCFAMIKHNSLHDAMNDAEQMAIAHSL